MNTIAEYLLKVTSQYQNSPKFLEWLSIPLLICQHVHECSDNMPAEFDLDSAVGVQLDIIGQYLGQSRTLPFDPTDGTSPYLEDNLYRKILVLKTMTNYWDGSLHSIYVAWNAIFDEAYLKIIDNMDMTATVTLSGLMTQLVKDMIYNDLILPRPEGVQYIYSQDVIPETAATFSYDMNTDYFKGYDESWWDKKVI
jgi:hypothetical protein